MKVYFAHSFANRFHIRDNIIPMLQESYPEYEFVNPFLREGRENQGLFETTSHSEKELAESNNIDNRDEHIVENDLRQLEECDILMLWVDNLSFGAPCEFFYNSYVLNKPTITVFPTENDLYYHPWVNYLSTEKIILEE
jgi:hypothetical protein